MRWMILGVVAFAIAVTGFALSRPSAEVRAEPTPPTVTEVLQPDTVPSSTSSITVPADTPTIPADTTTTTTTTALSPILSAFCPSTAHAAVVDRDRQRAWLCDRGVAVYEFPFTGAITQPDPGTYPVYAKDLAAWSPSSEGTSDMTHFVAFTRGTYRGARIAFHSVPVWRSNGALLQPLESVGDPARRGESAGCLRVLPDDAVRVWDWLDAGDEVRVVN